MNIAPTSIQFCPNCGQFPLQEKRYPEVIVCTQCALVYRVPASRSPVPPPGPPIMQADLANPDVPGWKLLNKDKTEIKYNHQIPELVATFSDEDLYYPVIRTVSSFDDIDITLNIRFIQGEYTWCHAGVEIRSGDHGDYVISISPQGTFRVGYHKGTDWGGLLSPWRDHSALKPGWESANQLRILARKDQIRVYLNGVFAASVRDSQYHSGLVRVVLAPKKKKTVVAFSQMQLHEPK